MNNMRRLGNGSEIVVSKPNGIRLVDAAKARDMLAYAREPSPKNINIMKSAEKGGLRSQLSRKGMDFIKEHSSTGMSSASAKPSVNRLFSPKS